METIAATLESRLQTWAPETSQRVEAMVAELIELADAGALEIGRSRELEQEVLDLLDEPAPR